MDDHPSWIPLELITIAKDLGTNKSVTSATTRTLLGWFNSQRRGRIVVAMIRAALEHLKLRTEPNFEYAWIDGELQFFAAPAELTADSGTSGDASAEAVATPVGAPDGDPTYRIAKLPSANTRPTSVNPNASVEEAVTLMLLNDYSQLPVLQGDRALKGAVTWQSIGTRMALGHHCATVQDCIEEAIVIGNETSLFAAIPAIVDRGYVLIRDHQNIISGIVTTTDLSLQFRQLAEPFLLLGEIENHVRRLSDGKFSPDEVASVKDPSDATRPINDFTDLTFGEHVRLLEKPERWAALCLKIDRGTFVKQLNEVREIRNDVMHFDPDGTAPSELQKLRSFVRLLSALGH